MGWGPTCERFDLHMLLSRHMVIPAQPNPCRWQVYCAPAERLALASAEYASLLVYVWSEGARIGIGMWGVEADV